VEGGAGNAAAGGLGGTGSAGTDLGLELKKEEVAEKSSRAWLK
jgi:hypothetical protein